VLAKLQAPFLKSPAFHAFLLEAQALIQGVSMVSLASAGRGGMLLLDEPTVDHCAADESAAASAHVRNRRNSRNLTRQKVGKV